MIFEIKVQVKVQSIEYFKISKVMLSGYAATSTILINAFLISAFLISAFLRSANSQKRANILLLKNRVHVRDSAIATIEH